MLSWIFSKAIGIAVVVMVMAVFMDFINFMDIQRQYFKHHPGKCRLIEGADFGSEDFQILSSGLAFVTSGLASTATSPGFWNFLTENNVKGRILLLDLSAPEKTVKELKIRPSDKFNISSFRPHGLSVLEDKVNGEHLIYVVNHRISQVDCVEKFKYLPSSGELEHVKSFSSGLIKVVNDVAVTGEDKFYLTNCAYFQNKLLLMIEQLLRIPLHDVVYFNGRDFAVAEQRLSGPNGVSVSKDGRHVYVAMLLTKSIRVYERSPRNGSLVLVQEVRIGTGPDNFHLSENGDFLYSGNHPLVSKLLLHMEDPHQEAPSQVLRFPLKDGLIDEAGITELFYDHGDLISGSSVGAVYKDKLYIGSVMHKLVECDLHE